ncbi:cellobiose transport system substrate-binding protein [Kineococcus xinjiangensis]|uniref:Cellobiose transport system substrate-binding protein n=1 Tax=Kineococcus xinjiangensis TaxID=512762 RepID=A0A2S6IV35_9ACTN|nr:extracellular solute-binding protein [Kineococcus xinjiangensis]PPK98049.1 cellobiose transport system substrate-binding protein [Kineococcus xinjiangensis]
MRNTRKPWLTLVAGIAGTALLTACGGGGAGTSGEDGKTTLTIATFNEFGYEELLKEYEASHPDIKIEHRKAATTNEARDNMNTRIAAGGSGLADIEAIEVDWLPELMQYPDNFADLSDPEVEGRWLDWKAEQATTEDGKLIGYGTDIGPQGICYRADLFEAAGLPTDRAEVAEFLGDSWESYFAAGEKFTAASDAAWYDSAGAIYQGMINQVEAAYEKPDGTPIPLDQNAEAEKVYETVLNASVDRGLSAGLTQWSEDWTNAFQNDGFATMLCPGWMLGVIEGNAAGVQGWDIADTFPGGGGNWGGSFLTVPAAGKNVEAAQDLAAWLTAPEQQLKAFEAQGTFPSQVEALASDELLSQKDAFFNDAPTGQILANRADAVEVTPFKGPNYFAIHETVADAITRVDTDKTDDAAGSWAKAVQAYGELGLD